MERSFTARAPPPAVPAPPSSITLSLPSTPRGSARKDSLRGDSNLDDSAVEPVEPLPAPNTPSARQSPKARTPKRSSGARPPPIQVAAGEGAVVPEGPVLGFEEDHEVVIVPSLEEVRFQDVFKDQLEGTQVGQGQQGGTHHHGGFVLDMHWKVYRANLCIQCAHHTTAMCTCIVGLSNRPLADRSVCPVVCSLPALRGPRRRTTTTC